MEAICPGDSLRQRGDLYRADSQSSCTEPIAITAQRKADAVRTFWTKPPSWKKVPEPEKCLGNRLISNRIT